MESAAALEVHCPQPGGEGYSIVFKMFDPEGKEHRAFFKLGATVGKMMQVLRKKTWWPSIQEQTLYDIVGSPPFPQVDESATPDDLRIISNRTICFENIDDIT